MSKFDGMELGDLIEKQLELQSILASCHKADPSRVKYVKEFTELCNLIRVAKQSSFEIDKKINSNICDILKEQVGEERFKEFLLEARLRLNKEYIPKQISIFTDEQSNILFGNEIEKLKQQVKDKDDLIKYISSNLAVLHDKIKIEGQIEPAVFDMLTFIKSLIEAMRNKLILE